MDDASTLTITFDEPIKFSGKTANEVTLREPTVAEFVAASSEKFGLGVTQALLVSVGKLDAGIAAKVPLSKARQAEVFINSFLTRGLPGEEPAEPLPPQPGDAEAFAAMQLREPTVAELAEAGIGMLGTAKLVSLVTGLSLELTRRMPVTVARRADEFFNSFAAPSPTTGNA